MKNLNYYNHQNTLVCIYIYMLIFKILLYLENLEKIYIYIYVDTIYLLINIITLYNIII